VPVRVVLELDVLDLALTLQDVDRHLAGGLLPGLDLHVGDLPHTDSQNEIEIHSVIPVAQNDTKVTDKPISVVITIGFRWFNDEEGLDSAKRNFIICNYKQG